MSEHPCVTSHPAPNQPGARHAWASAVAEAPCRKPLFLRRLLARCLRLGVLPAEPLYASSSVDQALLAGEKGMANRADFHVNVALMSRTGLEIVSASAKHPHCGVIRVNFFLRHLLKRPFLQSLHCRSNITRLAIPTITRDGAHTGL